MPSFIIRVYVPVMKNISEKCRTQLTTFIKNANTSIYLDYYFGINYVVFFVIFGKEKLLLLIY